MNINVYGAILNPNCRFFDKRIGQSTTLTGRTIAKHMDSFVNECITGEYDHVGDAIIYGDSVTGDSIIQSSIGKIRIDQLFNKIDYKVITDHGKEYAIPTSENDNFKVLGYSAYEDNADYNEISYIMRHKTKKQLWQIETESGKKIIVTEDHSVIVDRDGFIVEIKPSELLETDLLISVNFDK